MNATLISENEKIDINFLQSGRRLAFFTGKLSSLLKNPNSLRSSILNENESSVFLKPTKCFPGTLSPNLHFNIRISRKNNFSNHQYKMKDSANHCPKLNEIYASRKIRRQKPVCHTKFFNEDSDGSFFEFQPDFHRSSSNESNTYTHEQ